VSVQQLVLAPAERADLIVDFAGMPVGSTILMQNDAPTPFPGGDRPDPRTTGRILQFRVVALTGADASRVPEKLGDIAALGTPALTRTLTLDEHVGHEGPLAALLDGKHWTDPVSETPALGETEIWEFANLTPDAHPIHLHLVQFQVLDRQPFRAEEYAELQRPERGPLGPFLSGPVKPPDPNERGWKDTVRANPGEVTRILVRFAPMDGGNYSFDATAQPGYVWHCHILEHEDNEMMRPYVVRRPLPPAR
jgi:FtsP/CotA-like multicopper oxidase with cupredoxin domain